MDHSDVAQWQYVPSKSNPADYGSRGLDRTCLAKVKTWYEGPKFLWEPESSWKRDHTVKDIDTDHPETKKEVFVNSTEVKTDILETLETHFSNWDKIRKAIPKKRQNRAAPANWNIRTTSKHCWNWDWWKKNHNGTEQSICRRKAQ